MTPFRKKTSRCWFVTITTKERTHVRRSSGTHDFDTAQAMQDMLTALSRRGSRSWDVIDAIVDGVVTVAHVFDHWPDRMDDLRRELADVDLAPKVDEWDRNLTTRQQSGDLAPATVKHYRRQVDWLFPKDDAGTRLPVRQSTLTPGFFKTKLAEVPGSNTNKRRHAAGWNSLLSYLVESGALASNPLDAVTLPKNNKAERPRIDRLEDVIRFVNTMPAGPHRAAAAMREGAGVELQAVLNTRRRDIVDEANRVIWAHGEKNEHRDRQVVVDEWAWEILLAYVRATKMHPDAPLFPGVTEKSHRRQVYKVRDALRKVGVAIPATYRPHHCRNTYAVRSLRAGKDPVLIANNLGHADTSELLRLYGKHRPAITDLVRADQRKQKESK